MNTEIPYEAKMNERNRNRQLVVIIQNTAKWMDVLAHDCNGLLNNINWVSKIMLDEKAGADFLSKDAFVELNQTTQHNIFAIKSIQTYCQVMKMVAEKADEVKDPMMVSEGLLFTSIPRMAVLNTVYNGLKISVSRAFARVLIFLISKMLEAAEVTGRVEHPIQIVIKTLDQNGLHVTVSSDGLIWPCGIWSHSEKDSMSPLSDARLWPRQMFDEMLALVGGEQMSKRSPVSLTEEGYRPKFGNALIQQELDDRHFEFSLPLGLGRH